MAGGEDMVRVLSREMCVVDLSTVDGGALLVIERKQHNRFNKQWRK